MSWLATSTLSTERWRLLPSKTKSKEPIQFCCRSVPGSGCETQQLSSGMPRRWRGSSMQTRGIPRAAPSFTQHWGRKACSRCGSLPADLMHLSARQCLGTISQASESHLLSVMYLCSGGGLIGMQSRIQVQFLDAANTPHRHLSPQPTAKSGRKCHQCQWTHCFSCLTQPSALM